MPKTDKDNQNNNSGDDQGQAQNQGGGNGNSDSNTPQYLTQDQAEKLFQDKLSNVGTLTQQEKQDLISFTENMGVILDVIETNPELKRQVQEGARQRMGGSNANQDQGNNNQGVSSQQQNQGQGQNNDSQVPNSQVKELDQQVGSVVRSRRAEIIEGFEKQYGIANLPEAERGEARKKIATKLLQWGHKVETIPVDHLKGLFEDAYLASSPEKLRDQSYTEGILAARAGDNANMPAMSSGSAQSSDNQGGKLTQGQQNYAEKLGVDVDRAKEVVKETT